MMEAVTYDAAHDQIATDKGNLIMKAGTNILKMYHLILSMENMGAPKKTGASRISFFRKA